MLGYVVADDLTGSCDVGIQFSKHGFKTVVSTNGGLAGGEFPGDIMVVNTDTRISSPETAYRRVREIAVKIGEQGGKLLYKKIDSTLKGNLGVEMDALLTGLPIRFILVCPAYPENHRFLVDGTLLVEDGSSRKDGGVNLVELLQRQSRHRIGYVELYRVETGGDGMKRMIDRISTEGCRIIVCDATERRHLDHLSRVIVALRGLPCGSAGLAGSYAPHLHQTGGRTLIISGSMNPVTLKQIAHLNQARRVETLDWRDPSSQLPLNGEEGHGIYLYASALHPEDVDLSKPPETFSKRLGEASLKLCRRLKPSLLILIGGETAKEVLANLGVEELELLREVEPGIPLAKITGGPLQGLFVVTKAGGFGEDETLQNLIECLT